MVQVGNETNTEILLPSKVEESHPIDWERNVALLNAGIVGVAEAGRLTGQTPKVMLHIAQPENVEPWFDFDYETTSAHSGFDFLSHSYSLPVPVQFRFTSGDREATAPLYLWASFLEGNDFAIKLVPENGEFSYTAMLPAGTRIQYQLYASPDIEEGLLSGAGPRGAGVISATVRDDGLVVIESLDRESLDGQ
jgi:hypothetical protein